MSALAVATTPERRPPASGDADAWATGIREAGARELRASGHELRVVTWNVWFSSKRQSERRTLLLRELAAVAADVVGLQEVTEETAERLRRHAGLLERYAVSPNVIHGYGVLLLARRALRPAFGELALPTTQGRSCVFAQLDGIEGRRIVVATVHLESLDSERTRRAQLRDVAGFLKPFDASLLVGDFKRRAAW